MLQFAHAVIRPWASDIVWNQILVRNSCQVIPKSTEKRSKCQHRPGRDQRVTTRRTPATFPKAPIPGQMPCDICRSPPGSPGAPLPCRDALAAAPSSAHDRFCPDRKSTRLNSSHLGISYAVFCLKKKTYDCTALAFWFSQRSTILDLYCGPLS